MEMSPCCDSSRIRLTLVPKLYHRLSMQQLIDCDTTDLGCGGGLMDQAFAYDEDAVGLCALSEYPFAYHRHWFYGCSRYMPYCTPLDDTRVQKFMDVNKTEADLAAAIATQPVSVAVVAADDWQFYSGGIYDGGCANPDDIDHGERDGVGEVGCWLTITFRFALKMRIFLLNANFHLGQYLLCIRDRTGSERKASSPSATVTTIPKKIPMPRPTASGGITGWSRTAGARAGGWTDVSEYCATL